MLVRTRFGSILRMEPTERHHVLTQIYEISTEDEARAISALGIDHVGVLVGDGRFPRELSLEQASRVAQAIAPSSKFSALFLSADVAMIALWAAKLQPAILHLGASATLLAPADVAKQGAPAGRRHHAQRACGGRGERRDCAKL